MEEKKNVFSASESYNNNNGEEEIMFASVDDNKNKNSRVPVKNKGVTYTTVDLSSSVGPSEKKKKSSKAPVIIAASAAAALCIAVVGAVIISTGAGRVQTAESSTKTESSTVSSDLSVQQESISRANSDKIIKNDVFVVQHINTKSIKFGKNVTVEGVDVSGKTLVQAYRAVQDTLLKLRDKVEIIINIDGTDYTLTEDDFVYDTDVSDVLVQAYHYSRGELTNSTAATAVDNGKTDFKVQSVLNIKSVDTAADRLAEKVDIKPVDARVTKFEPKKKEKFTYADGKNGFLIDREKLKSNIKSVMAKSEKTGRFTMKKVETPFKRTLALLKANTKLIASHRTTAANVYASNFNMELAIKAASGYEVKPGATFSFNKMTGDTTNGYEHRYSNGVVGSYVPSTAIVSGKYEQQYGGGICQASTTLYNCAMKADMDPVERHAHQFPSSYADYGLDATVDYGNLDMKFKNNKDYSVYIATYVYDSNGDGLDELNVEMYGPISKEYDEIVTVGWINGAYDNSYSAKGAKVYFKNGKEVKRAFLPEGSYDYHYDSYYSAVNQMPSDTKNGPSVSPTKKPPTIYSPEGCGSCAPVKYGTAAKVLADAEKASVKVSSNKAAESSKTESSKTETSKTEVSKPESSTTVKITTQNESSKQESSKPESSKQESSKPESRQESRQESSKPESRQESRQESSKPESKPEEESSTESHSSEPEMDNIEE